MSLKFAVLGLLALQPASGYDIKRTIDRSIYFIWNVTGPQIYNTLRSLRDDGYIESESIPQAGRPDKQLHTITPAGRRALADFVHEPIGASVTRDEVLLRIFFGNFAEEKIVLRELDAYLGRIRHERAALEAVEARVTAHPGPRHQARKFQLLSLRLKVAQYRAMEQELQAFCRANGKGRRPAAKAPDRKPTLALVHPAEPARRGGK
jgi:PadR family transcriptional regulator AphA